MDQLTGRCEIARCFKRAVWEGWIRKVDPFTGQPVAHVRIAQVCNTHKSSLIGSEQREK